MKVEDKENVKLFHLMGNAYVAIAKEEPKKIMPKVEDETEEEKQDKAKRYKAKTFHVKEKNQKLLKMTEEDANFNNRNKCFFMGELTRNYIKENDAVMSHIIAFESITKYATKNKYRIGYGEYRKRIKQAAIKHEWKLIRQWISNNIRDAIIAVSIGVGVKGYIYIRFIITSSEDVKVHDASISIANYLRKNRKYFPKDLKPFEGIPESFIRDKYYNEDIKTIDDIIDNIPEELWQVMRAGFTLPFTHRTYKNGLARILIDKSADKAVIDDNLGDNSILWRLHKAFVEKDAEGNLVPVEMFNKCSPEDINIWDDEEEPMNESELKNTGY